MMRKMSRIPKIVNENTQQKNREGKNNSPALYVRKMDNGVVVSSPPAHMRMKVLTGGVCMWERNESLATHHCPYNNFPQLTP